MHFYFLHRFTTLAHLFLSVAAVIVFFLSLFYVRNEQRHSFLARGFIYMGLVSVLISLVMTGLGIGFPEFARYNDNPSAHFLRNLRISYATQFGYIIATLRGFTFSLLAAETLHLQGLLRHPHIVKVRGILGVLILGCLVFLLLQPHRIFTFYYISLLSLALGVLLVWGLLKTPTSHTRRSHSLVGLYAFLVFAETGILGGIRGKVPWLPENSLWSFTIARLIPLVIVLLYWNFRLRKVPTA